MGFETSFNHEAFISRQNADRANDLGNLYSRSLTMIAKYNDQVIPEVDESCLTSADRELIAAFEKMLKSYRQSLDDFGFSKALQVVWEVISLLNKFIVINAPWELAKDSEQAGRLRTVLYFLAESLRIITVVIQPFMPAAALKMAAGLQLSEELCKGDLQTAGRWGLTVPGVRIVTGEQLFPRLDKKKKKQAQPAVAKKKKSGKEEGEQEGLLTFDQFQKMELRVAEIVAAEKIKKADKLLKLTLMAPEERTVVAGIAKYYEPEELLGKLVIIVANLKPVKLMGVVSCGMVLAAKEKDEDGQERLVLSTVSGDVAPGAKVA